MHFRLGRWTRRYVPVALCGRFLEINYVDGISYSCKTVYRITNKPPPSRDFLLMPLMGIVSIPACEPQIGSLRPRMPSTNLVGVANLVQIGFLLFTAALLLWVVMDIYLFSDSQRPWYQSTFIPEYIPAELQFVYGRGSHPGSGIIAFWLQTGILMAGVINCYGGNMGRKPFWRNFRLLITLVFRVGVWGDKSRVGYLVLVVFGGEKFFCQREKERRERGRKRRKSRIRS